MNIAPVVASVPETFTPAVDQHARKIAEAAHDFEAVLLNSLLGPLEKTFSSLPGKETDVASDNYQSLGMQALASSLAAKGGVGIAEMIVKSLSKRDNAVAAAHEKSLARGASLARPF
jgi:Rod binding domain-containing protein